MRNEEHIKSFVKRSGRITNVQRYFLKNKKNNHNFFTPTETINLYKLFDNKNPCVLDIGFGDGKLLSNIAKINTNINFIGLEVYESGIGNILKQIEKSNLSNLKVSNIDAVSFLKKYVQNNSFYGISLFFPDPWPKKRHYKRRIINANFLENMLMKIKKNGFVKIVTDWENYGERIIELLDENKKFEKIQDISIYKERILTKFEKRGISQGNRIIDLTYKVK
tara:strand:- start:1403 stop:2068 length:666 start_codon:yes stop_codon:yes gene_type:complete